MVATAPPARTVAAPRARRLRGVLSWLHLWVGLGVGALFALIGLSGTVLVFHDDLLRWQHPQLVAQEARADGAVLADVLATWRPRGLTAIDVPKPGLAAWQGYFADGRRGYFAPDDGALLLMRSVDDDALLWLHEFHTGLLGGEAGHQAVGLIGWVSLGLLLTGLYLWWPRRGRLRAQLTVHAGPPVRRWLTWHRSAGALLLPLLLLSTLTGVGMVYHDGARALLVALFGGGDPPAEPKRAPTDAAPDWPRILATAATALPDARLTRIALPAPGSDVIGFRARMAGEWHPNGRSLVFVDAAGQRALGEHDATAQPAGARLSEAIYPLHIGSVGGATYRWLTALAGLLPAFLLATGFLFWRRRRGKR